MYRRGSTEISSHVHSFQDEEEATNAMLSFFLPQRSNEEKQLSFFLPQRSNEEKQMTLILGLELTNIKCCSCSESNDKTIRPTVSMAVATLAWYMRR